MIDNPLIPPTNRGMPAINTARPGGVTPDAKVPRVNIEQGTVKSEETATADQVQVSTGNMTADVLEELLPLPILNSGELQQTEWGWRRLLFQVMTAAATSDSPQTKDMGTPTQSTPDAKAIRELWNVVVKYGAAESTKEWQSEWNDPTPQERLIPFSDLRERHLDKLPAKVKDWVLSDRLNASVAQSADQVRGGGIYLPEPRTPADRQTAVKWQAQRHTKFTADQTPVHRLVFDLKVGSHPVQVILLFAKPSMMIHLATNDPTLQHIYKTNASDEAVKERFRSHGWNLDRFSVGPLGDEGDGQ